MSQEVVLDAIIRDKHGSLVRNLKPDEVQIFEGGKLQPLKSFRLIDGRKELPKDANQVPEEEVQNRARPADTDSHWRRLPEINVVSLVFGPIAVVNRHYARQAALDFVDSELLPNTYIAVYSLGHRLNALQAYSNDKKQLIQSIDYASRSLYAEYPERSQLLWNQIGGTIMGLGEDKELSTGDASIQLKVTLTTEYQLILKNRLSDAYGAGMDQIEALKSLILSQAKLPGRKVVIMFSDGLQIPIDRREMIEQLLSDANRANVTFYTVDVGGLESASPINAAQQELNRVAASSAMQAQVGHGLSGDALLLAAQEMDDIQLMSVSDQKQAMRELAERTGGFAIGDTNDVRKPMRRIMEDVSTHYELTYSPSGMVYDGRFRNIELKISRSGLRVQTRRGYYAVPTINGESLQPFEVKALDTLRIRPLPRDFNYGAEVLQFRPSAASVQCEMAFDVPLASLTIMKDSTQRKLRIHASLLAIIRDEQGVVVEKMSRDFNRQFAAEQESSLREGHITVTEPVVLKAGRYTLETIVLDQARDRAAARRSAFYIECSPRLGLSTLTPVRRIDALNSEEPDPLNPLDSNSGRIRPALLDNVQPNEPIDFFLVIYRNKLEPERPKLDLEFFSDGKLVGHIEPEVTAADSSGAIPVLTNVRLPRGQYEIRATARQNESVTRSRILIVN
ncbi:MAG: VWA domain-containing protein [Acidobacteriaceae bacterium]|nr:VWA domain-containing protein [Acidobacteriaceae bacterium]